jgi:hypothetical protein
VWQSADPILGEYLPTGNKEKDNNLPGMGGVFNSFNLSFYSYSTNNPIKYADVDGNLWWIPALIIGSYVVDYGWTAYDLYQANKTLNNSKASSADKMLAMYDISTAVSFEVSEPDEAMPFRLPLDDIARVSGRKILKESLEKGASKVDDVNWAKVSGMFTDLKRGKGNFGIGSGTRSESEALAKAWLGDGFKISSDGKAWISKDGLRQYRPPSSKPRLGKTQSNFEWRNIGNGKWHLDITE